ncbi:MAG: SufE family protein [Bacteroidota bacterium]
MTINELQNTIVKEFEMLDSWKHKFQYLIEHAHYMQDNKLITPHSEQQKIEEKIDKVRLTAYQANGRIFFSAMADNTITQGIVGVLIRILSNRRPEEIISADIYILDRLKLKNSISSIKLNKMFSLLRIMKFSALDLKKNAEYVTTRSKKITFNKT